MPREVIPPLPHQAFKKSFFAGSAADAGEKLVHIGQDVLAKYAYLLDKDSCTYQLQMCRNKAKPFFDKMEDGDTFMAKPGETENLCR